MPFWKTPPSLSDLEEEEENLKAEFRVTKTKREIMEEKVAKRELEERLGSKSIVSKLFGAGKAFNLKKAKDWIKAH